MTRGAQGPEVGEITSRDNPLLKRIRRLAAQPTAYREGGHIWVEATTCAGRRSIAVSRRRWPWSRPTPGAMPHAGASSAVRRRSRW
jgi:hypothetical protein